MVDDNRILPDQPQGPIKPARITGRIASFDQHSGLAWIEGDDGNLYYFSAHGTDSSLIAQEGQRVSFAAEDGQAVGIKPASDDSDSTLAAATALPPAAESAPRINADRPDVQSQKAERETAQTGRAGPS